MLEILTPDAYAGTQRLGARLAEGMREAVERCGLPRGISTTSALAPSSAGLLATDRPM